VLPIIVGIREQCSVVGVRLGQCRLISMSKLGSIITSALLVATMLICQRACICVGVCVWVLQCEETCLHALRFVSALRLSPVSWLCCCRAFLVNAFRTHSVTTSLILCVRWVSIVSFSCQGGFPPMYPLTIGGYRPQKFQGLGVLCVHVYLGPASIP
jgi:hypothetical protein